MIMPKPVTIVIIPTICFTEYVSPKIKYPIQNIKTVEDVLVIMLFTAGVLYFLSKSSKTIVDTTVEALDIVIVHICGIDNFLYCINALSITVF